MKYKFNLSIIAATLLAITNPRSPAFAHGIPIHLDVVNNALSVSGGLADTVGYAPMIFVQSDEAGDPFGEVNLPGFGPAIVWQVPGYEIFGMDENSGLFIQVLSRPVATSNPVEHRVLWYWNPATQKVENSPPANPFEILKTTSQYVTLSPTDGTAPPPLQIAAPLASDEGYHNHLVAYALSDATPAPTGVYGFFARLTSNEYGASDPFLVVFNNEVFDYSQMIPAALAINAAAFLPGDYNRNYVVDAADYVVWRKTLGSTTNLAADGSGNGEIDGSDYGIWRSNFGTTEVASGLSSAIVPEPQAWLLLVAGLSTYVLVARRQPSRHLRCIRD
jgi:hypothetical protein